MTRDTKRIIVIGAGMGGLAAAIRLRAAGHDVTLLEQHAWPGGKMRVMESDAGPVDAGPTVLTLPDVLENLFAACGRSLSDKVELVPLAPLARHYWQDGTMLNLTHTPEENASAIEAAFGAGSRDDYMRFHQETAALYTAFEAPVMRRAKPDVLGAAQAALKTPQVWPWLMPGRSLNAMLRKRFRDPRLVQLFGRYATYVGGNPLIAPAVLGLIWQAEAGGVWAVKGGMAALARALADLFVEIGGDLRLGAGVDRINTAQGAVSDVRLETGDVLLCDQVVFNGDPQALLELLLHRPKPSPRSLSARVWTFAAEVQDQGLGKDALAYHTLFFADDPAVEFGPLAKGRTPQTPTLYLCAQDRATGRPDGLERFQIILNAPATDAGEEDPCQTHPSTRLKVFGLHLSPEPETDRLTTPEQFGAMFPASRGALYGMSPNGAMATFQRPTVHTKIKGLVRTGGGVHPGAGVPMALLSGQFAAEALMGNQTSQSPSPRMAMRGGMSMG